MLHTVKLLLPALIPSWRFFDQVAPSPRIEFRALASLQDDITYWQEFRPRPAHLPLRAMLKRMVWNPRWNESLFLVSCAERLTEKLAEHSIREIITRIKADLAGDCIDPRRVPYLQFRLVFVSRNGNALHKEVTFVSEMYPYADEAQP
jgi:hypothetical protein